MTAFDKLVVTYIYTNTDDCLGFGDDSPTRSSAGPQVEHGGLLLVLLLFLYS